MSQLIEND